MENLGQNSSIGWQKWKTQGGNSNTGPINTLRGTIRQGRVHWHLKTIPWARSWIVNWWSWITIPMTGEDDWGRVTGGPNGSSDPTTHQVQMWTRGSVAHWTVDIVEDVLSLAFQYGRPLGNSKTWNNAAWEHEWWIAFQKRISYYILLPPFDLLSTS